MIAHAVVWLDHWQARVFHLTEGTVDERALSSPRHHLSSDRGGKSHDRVESREANDYYDAIADCLADSKEVLIVGPGTAKLALIRRLFARHAAIASRVVGIESADHPTDPHILAQARLYFAGSGTKGRRVE